MDNYTKNRLEECGIDVDGALERFMGSENILFRILKKFAEDDNFDKLTDALSQGDMETALAASHTLKGICGNLSMQKLFGLLTEQVKLFREGDTDSAAALMEEISPAYYDALETIIEITG